MPIWSPGQHIPTQKIPKSSPGQITGFTDHIIEDTTSKCDFLFSVDDIIEQISVLSVQHAFKVYDCLCEVFTDLQQESLEQ